MKKIGYAMLALGCVVIVLSIIFVMKNISNNDEKMEIKFENITGDEIDNSLYNYYKKELNEKYSIKSSNTDIRNIYTILYSNEFIDFFTGEYAAMFASETEGTISVSTLIDNNDFSVYVENLLNDYRENGAEKISLAEGSGKYEGYDVSYYKIQSYGYSEIENDKNYIEEFLFAIKESDNYYVNISYKIVNQKFDEKFLSDYANSIIIEKGKASYLYTSTEGEFINVNLKSDKLFGVTEDYQLNLKLLSEKYEEIEDYKSSSSSNTFRGTEEEIINISLANYIGDDYKKVFIEEQKQSYASGDIDYKIISEDIISYDDYEFYRLAIEVPNSEINYFYDVYLICSISDDLYYIVSCNGLIDYDQTSLEDFLTFDLTKN